MLHTDYKWKDLLLGLCLERGFVASNRPGRSDIMLVMPWEENG